MPATDLPTEIILEIALYLGFEDVTQTHLALTSRRFYSALIPQILAYEARYIQDVMIPQHRVVIHQEHDKADRSTETQPQSNSVQTLFTGTFRILEFEAGPDSKDLRCVRGIVLRAPQLERVTLRIPKSGCLLRRVVAYINILASRPNLALTILGGQGDMYTMSAVICSRSTPAQGISSVLTAANRLLRSWSPRPTKRDPRTPLSLIPRPQLTSLTIEDARFLMSPVAPIVQDLMNEAPITSLCITDPAPNFLDSQWSRTLLSVTMPVLTHLSLANLTSFPDLFGFLKLHPSITHLTLDMIPTQDIPAVEFPKALTLPHLTFLAATPRYLVPFIHHRQQRGGFPRLEHLSLRVPLRFVYERPYLNSRGGHDDHPSCDFHPVYDLIICGHYKSVTIDGIKDSGLVEWMISSPKCTAGWPPPRQLSSVEELVIVNDFTTSDQTHVALLEWIDQHCPSLPRDIFTGTEAFTPAQSKKMLLERLIWYTCPQLKILQLGTNDAYKSAIVRIHRPSTVDTWRY